MELIRALGELAEAPGPEQVRTARLLELPGEPARNEYTDLFVVQLYPYASVYLSPDGQLGGQVQEHIAGFWRVLRQPVPRDPDHIATLFVTYSQLSERSRDNAELYLQTLTRQMRHAFLWEHIASWMVPFVARVRELGSPVYRGWSALVLDALEAEAGAVGPPSVLPLQLRNAPALPDNAGAETIADIMFAPVRSGCILTRADLARCARDLQLNTRVADRRYTLRALIAQDQARVLSWLAAEAQRQADLISVAPPPFASIANFWRERAQQSASLLLRAARQANPARLEL